jgi:hypothetical protein
MVKPGMHLKLSQSVAIDYTALLIFRFWQELEKRATG